MGDTVVPAFFLPFLEVRALQRDLLRQRYGRIYGNVTVEFAATYY